MIRCRRFAAVVTILALAVAQDGTLVYSRGYGYTNLDYDIPITPQTVFDVAPVADDLFEIRFDEQGLSGPQPASLEFDRNRTGAITGFGLSSGSERGIVFERR